MSEMAALVGVQTTLVGLFLATFFDGVSPYPLVGLLLAIVGTIVVGMAAYGEWG